VRNLMNSIFDQAGCASVDWSEPDRWIDACLGGDLGALARKVSARRSIPAISTTPSRSSADCGCWNPATAYTGWESVDGDFFPATKPFCASWSPYARPSGAPCTARRGSLRLKTPL
jgi:hypothetical protein